MESPKYKYKNIEGKYLNDIQKIQLLVVKNSIIE